MGNSKYFIICTSFYFCFVLLKTDSKSEAKETSKKAKSSQEEKNSQGKSESKDSNFKIISWNVSGVRAWIKVISKISFSVCYNIINFLQ